MNCLIIYLIVLIFFRPAYFKLIEECISQVVLHRNGYDPDFRVGQKISIDVQPLIESLLGTTCYLKSHFVYESFSN